MSELMRSHIMRRLVLPCVLVALAVSCAPTTVERTTAEAPSSDADPLGVCETRRVQLRETPVGAAELSEDAVAKLYDEAVVKLLHGKVTVGKTHGATPSTDGTIFVSANGARLKDFDAWVVVRDGIRKRISGGPPAASQEEADAPRDESYVTAWADIVDSRTGDVVHGWSCASETHLTDGKVTTYRGVDPDKREKDTR
jgi:hypothetical protein